MPKSPAEIRITTACIVNGQYYREGEVLPFEREEDLPPSLRGLVATGAEPAPFNPAERDFYRFPGPEPAGFVYQGVSDGAWVRRQASQAAGVAQEADWAAEQLEREQALPAETIAALEDIHDRASRLAKAQLQANRDAVDAAYEAAEAEAEAKTSRFFVKRGGMWAKTQNAKLRPGETCFVRRENGEYEASGCVDALGTPPDSEITP